ncbi:unnamed protein product, partial [Gulo gulo]
SPSSGKCTSHLGAARIGSGGGRPGSPVLAGELRAPPQKANTQPPKDPETAVLGTHLGGRDARVHTNPHPPVRTAATQALAGQRSCPGPSAVAPPGTTPWRTVNILWSDMGPEMREHPDTKAAHRVPPGARVPRVVRAGGVTAPRVGGSLQGDKAAWELDTRADGARF